MNDGNGVLAESAERRASSPRSITQELASVAVEMWNTNLPANVESLARQLIADAVCCGVYGSTTAGAALLRSAFAGSEQATDHRIWGTATTTDARSAIFLNAASVHSFEFDDQCLGCGLHAGAATVPTGLTVGEQHGKSADDVTRAVAVGAEIGVRVGLLVGAGAKRAGFHTHGWTGAVASAVTASLLGGAGTEAVEHAIGVASSIAGGLAGAQFGGDAKRVSAGRAAEAGWLAAELALRDARSAPDMIGRSYGGLLSALTGRGHDEIEDLPRGRLHYVLAEVLAFKTVPAKIGIQQPYALLDAVLSDADAPRQAAVTAIDVAGLQDYVAELSRPLEVIGSVMGAQSSCRYLLASRVLDGPDWTRHFDTDHLTQPQRLELADRIGFHTDQPNRGQPQSGHPWRGLAVTVSWADGTAITKHEDECPAPGFPGVGRLGAVRRKVDQTIELLTPGQLDGVSAWIDRADPWVA